MSEFPERTCLGCGAKRPKAALYRLALSSEGQLVADRVQRLPGRGAYVCGAGCLAAAVKRKAFGRAFRGRGVAGVESVLSAFDSKAAI